TYGFLEESQPLVVAAIAVEAIAPATDGGVEAAPAPVGPATSTQVDAWVDGRWCRIPLFTRGALVPGRVLPGPALIAEDGATSYVAPGWSATLADDGNLVLRETA